MMEIRLTELKDLPLVMEIYDNARAFMRANGNQLNGLTVIRPNHSSVRR